MMYVDVLTQKPVFLNVVVVDASQLLVRYYLELKVDASVQCRSD